MYRFISALTFIVFLIKASNSLILQGHVDPLNYHLVVPKYLVNGQWNDAWRTIPGALMSGAFETLYLLPHLFFGYGVEAQVSSQFIHFILSLGLGSFLLFKYFKESNLVAVLAALSLLTISRGASFFFLAKNDGALALAYLACVLTYIELNREGWGNVKKIVLFSFLLGLIPAIKLNGLIYIFPIVVHFVIRHYRNWKRVGLVGITSLVVLSPFLLRNYYYIGTPFFPGLLNVFPGDSSEEMVRYYTGAMSAPLTLGTFFQNIKLIFMGKFLFLFSPLLVLVNLKKGRDSLNLPFYMMITSFIIFLGTNGGIVTDRFHFPSYFILVFFIFSTLSVEVKENQKVTKWAWILLLIILADSKLDKAIGHARKGFSLYFENSKEGLVRKVIGPSIFWEKINEDGIKKIYILSDNLSQQYYAGLNTRIIQVQHTPEANFLFHCKDADVRKLEKYRYAILWDKSGRTNPCYKKILAGELVTSHKEYKLYRL